MSTYEISKSSLLSLKAEILRKQEELNKVKLENDVKIRNLKKNAPLDLKNKGVEKRQAQDASEEEDLLKKSREALEAKSKLYEKLTKAKLSEPELERYRRFLVRFDKKNFDGEFDEAINPEEEDFILHNYEPPKNPDEEWVEYIDCLGRTRTCLRKDLEYLKNKDKDLKLIVEEKQRNRTPEPPPPKAKTPEPEQDIEPEMLTSDMRREMLRKQWEKEEEELKNKSDIHYQDILFNEARTHGVGYYGFSKDEEERAKQQEALKKLREETKNQQKKSQELRSMREKQLAARVRAAKNRKRIRMGLPPLEDDEEQPQEEKQAELSEDKEKEVEDKVDKKDEKRKKHVRPWDIGKEGVKHYEHTQEEWVDKRRKDRENEFAPPKSYDKRRRGFRAVIDLSDDEDERRGRREEFRPTKIVNELSDDEDDDRRRRRRGKGTEIAPPTTYDYYGPSDRKRRRRRDSDEMSHVSESIEAGLKFLREQMEKKDV